MGIIFVSNLNTFLVNTTSYSERAEPLETVSSRKSKRNLTRKRKYSNYLSIILLMSMGSIPLYISPSDND